MNFNALDTSKVSREKRQFAEAFYRFFAIVAPTCRVTGVSRSTYNKWFKSDAEFRRTILDAKELTLGFVEKQLWRHLYAGDLRAIIFYLETMGKDHGWTTEYRPPLPLPEDMITISKDKAPSSEELLEIVQRCGLELPEEQREAFQRFRNSASSCTKSAKVSEEDRQKENFAPSIRGENLPPSYAHN